MLPHCELWRCKVSQVSSGKYTAYLWHYSSQCDLLAGDLCNIILTSKDVQLYYNILYTQFVSSERICSE